MYARRCCNMMMRSMFTSCTCCTIIFSCLVTLKKRINVVSIPCVSLLERLATINLYYYILDPVCFKIVPLTRIFLGFLCDPERRNPQVHGHRQPHWKESRPGIETKPGNSIVIILGSGENRANFVEKRYVMASF